MKKRKLKKECESQRIENPLARYTVLGLASGLGLGYSPIAPGTAGSLLGIPLGLFLVQYPTWLAGILLVAALPLCSLVAERAGRHWGDMDAGRIVLDEVYGQALALLGLRHFVLLEGGGIDSIPYAYVFVGFVLFRIFDVFKPFPARTFDRQATGFSNMMDDVVAGLYAALILRALIRIWQS